MLDNSLVLRDGSSDLTADEAAAGFTGLKLGATPPGRPFFLHISMPKASSLAVGGADGVVFKLQGAHTLSGSYVDLVTTPSLTAKGVYDYGFVTDYEYYKLDVNVTDAGVDGVNFGAVVVEITPYARGPHDMPNR